MSEIIKALNAIQAEVGAIAKDRRNQQQRFQFRGFEDVYNRLHPLMIKHGIISVPCVTSTERSERPTKSGGTMSIVTLAVDYTFHATDGSKIVASVVGEGMDSGDKATSKAMSIAHKYALCQTFMIPTEDMPDPDAESLGGAEVYHQPPVDPIVMDAVVEFAKASSLDELKESFIKYIKVVNKSDHDKIVAAKNNRKAELVKAS